MYAFLTYKRFWVCHYVYAMEKDIMSERHRGC